MTATAAPGSASTRGLVGRAIHQWPPATFSFVMASGITSTALVKAGHEGWSMVPLVAALVGFAVLAVIAVVRLVIDPAAVFHSLTTTQQAFGYLTLVAGAGVLALRLDTAGADLTSQFFGWFAVCAGAVLLYVVPASLILRPGERDRDAGPDGSWLLWVVALQSLSLVVATVDLGIPHAAAMLSVSLWGSGVVLYLALTALVINRLLTSRVGSSDLLPSYWILTGATAISTLAALRLQGTAHAPTFITDVYPVITGAAYVLWSFGTWWVPLLVVIGAWRYTAGHQPLRFELGLWSILFPLGMYSTASMTLGASTGTGFITDVGKIGAVVTGVLWAIVVLAMLASALPKRIGRGEVPPQ
jgi:tellurite resistance protein TehA-like permease